MGILDAFGKLGARTANAVVQESQSVPPPEEQFEEQVRQPIMGIQTEALDPDDFQAKLVETIESLEDARNDYLQRLEIAEEQGWSLIANSWLGPGGGGDLSHTSRKDRNKAAERIWREDPVVGRGVDTLNEYVWGKGLPMPRAADKKVQRLIRSFWMDDDNQRIVTTYAAQICKGTELSLFGELFFVVFDQGRWANLDPDEQEDEDGLQDIIPLPDEEAKNQLTTALLPPSEHPLFKPPGLNGNGVPGAAGINGNGGPPQPGVEEEEEPEFTKPGAKPKPEPPPPPSAVKLGQIHPNEIEDVIPDEENAARPRYYKRRKKNRKYDYRDEGSWQYDIKEDSKIEYYEDMKYPPRENQNSPRESQVATGKIFHVAVNRHSFQLRGNSEMWRAVRWARALNDFFTWRLTLLRALATFVFRKKVKGGSAQVIQAAQRLVAPDGRTGTMGLFDPVAPPAPGSVLTENANETLDQFKTSSGAGEAEQDSQMLRGQIGVAMGLPIHYLGDKGSANLANATAMEVPVLKMVEARQELFEQAVTEILNYCIDKAIFEEALPEDVDRTFYVEMPQVLQRNVPEMVATLTNMMARLDPFAQDISLKRLTLQLGLTWLGYPDPDSVVRRVYPEGMENQQQLQPGMMPPEAMAAMQGGQPGGPAVPGMQPPPPPGAPGAGTGPAVSVPNPANPLAGGGPGNTGIAGPFSGAPEQLVPGQPYPGAHTGVTLPR